MHPTAYIGPAVTRRKQDSELLGALDQVDGNENSIFGAIRGRHSLRRDALVGEVMLNSRKAPHDSPHPINDLPRTSGARTEDKGSQWHDRISVVKGR